MPNAPITYSRLTARIMPWVVAVAYFLQMLDGTVLNTALVVIAGDFGVPVMSLQTAVIAYVLTAALVIPAGGALCERFGIRRVFLWAMGIFIAGSLGCAVSSSLVSLIVFRVVQGIGGALLIPTGRLFIVRYYPKEEFVEQMSFVTVPALIGPLAGPTVGAFLIDWFGWNSIFLINLPVGLIGLLAAYRFMPEIPAGQSSAFDGIGFVLFALFLSGFTFALEGAGEFGLNLTLCAVIAAASFLCLGAYMLHARGKKDALFPFALFKIPNFRAGIGGNFFARLGNTSMPFLMPLMLQTAFGYSVMETALQMIPMSLGSMGGKTIVIRAVARFGCRKVLVANTLLLALGIALFAFLGKTTPPYLMGVLFFAFGVMNATQFTVMNAVTLVDLGEYAASGNTLLTVVMQLCMSTSVAASAFFVSRLTGEGIFGVSFDVGTAFSWTFAVLSLLMASSAVVFRHVTDFAGGTQSPRP